MKIEYDVLVVGSGPAGLSAAIKCYDFGLRVALVEREATLGGILKQCIHEGFGLHRYGQQLTGPEYIHKDIRACMERKIHKMTATFITEMKEIKHPHCFEVQLMNGQGLKVCRSKTLILATGCRERTGRQIFLQGTRPSGVMTAGTAQYFVNHLGHLPGKKCLILGSGDIGMIMARRLTLEGSQVLGVYEAQARVSGIRRNVVQCLEDFEIPLHLSTTVTDLKGEEKLEAVKIVPTKNGRPQEGAKGKWVSCDTLILSVGLIPENEMAQSLGVKIDPRTKGPWVNQWMETTVKGVFSCGNALHVNDLVDYVSQSGALAGEGVMGYLKEAETSKKIKVSYNERFMYVLPQSISLESLGERTTFYFRVKAHYQKATLKVMFKDRLLKTVIFSKVSPPEMCQFSMVKKELLDLKKQESQDLHFILEVEEADDDD